MPPTEIPPIPLRRSGVATCVSSLDLGEHGSNAEPTIGGSLEWTFERAPAATGWLQKEKDGHVLIFKRPQACVGYSRGVKPRSAIASTRYPVRASVSRTES
jgi:hypothetical protein